MDSTFIYAVWSVALHSAVTYDNPLYDTELSLHATAPSGREIAVQGYWDGGPTWRVRFSPDETGDWHWRTACTDETNGSLHDRTGTFICHPYDGDNPIHVHGPIRLSDDRRNLAHADGTPFFWLADTAWNGVIRGDDSNWQRYLEARRDQRFTAIQFVSTHWRGDAEDALGETACTEQHPIRINPAFFQRLDHRVAMINEYGLVAAPVALWALLESDIGFRLDVRDAIRLARYIVARYGAYHVVWLLGGDGDYRKMGIERWKQIGRAVFADRTDRLVTLHPCGQSWIADEFRAEPWYHIVGYQSGHGDSEEHLRWLTDGSPAHQWDHEPILPVINLEPNYEGAIAYHHRTHFSEREVRRAAYWSLLGSPTAGLTYGHDAIWNWNFETGPSEGHGNWHDRQVPPWYTGLDTPGIRSMTVMRTFFEMLPWWTLRPCPELLGTQPGKEDVARTVVAARTTDGTTAIIYTPVGATIELTVGDFASASWVNPVTGKSTPARRVDPATTTPDDQDWLLVLRQ